MSGWTPCLKPGPCPCSDPCAVYAKCHQAVERMLSTDPFAIARAIAAYAATIKIEVNP